MEKKCGYKEFALTKRERVAAMALQGLLCHHGCRDDNEISRGIRYSEDASTGDQLIIDAEGYSPSAYYADDLAEIAVTYADALLDKLAACKAT